MFEKFECGLQALTRFPPQTTFHLTSVWHCLRTLPTIAFLWYTPQRLWESLRSSWAHLSSLHWKRQSMQPERMSALRAGFRWTHLPHLRGCGWHALIILLSHLVASMWKSSWAADCFWFGRWLMLGPWCPSLHRVWSRLVGGCICCFGWSACFMVSPKFVCFGPLWCHAS